jgi:hypothetical protein
MREERTRGGMRAAIDDFAYSSATCLLLVHPEIAILEQAATEVLSTYGWPCLTIGRELSAALLSELVSDRSRAARLWVAGRFASLGPGPVLCTEIDLLFDPALQLDVVGLLANVSRACRLVVAWPGEWDVETLTYGVPEHRHYRAWRRPQVVVFPLGGPCK